VNVSERHQQGKGGGRSMGECGWGGVVWACAPGGAPPWARARPTQAPLDARPPCGQRSPAMPHEAMLHTEPAAVVRHMGHERQATPRPPSTRNTVCAAGLPG